MNVFRLVLCLVVALSTLVWEMSVTQL